MDAEVVRHHLVEKGDVLWWKETSIYGKRGNG
jgi:hypothetical protein